jgi:hypothetical protein
MSARLNRDAILREMLDTLVRGWGAKAVLAALNEVVATTDARSSRARHSGETGPPEQKAVQMVQGRLIAEDRKPLMLQLAAAFDAGTAFPRMSDVRAFLSSHHQNVKELRSREQAFRKMLPLLERMSEKGLAKVISRSEHSGPAELNSISDAIKNSGESLRGVPEGDDSIS